MAMISLGKIVLQILYTGFKCRQGYPGKDGGDDRVPDGADIVLGLDPPSPEVEQRAKPQCGSDEVLGLLRPIEQGQEKISVFGRSLQPVLGLSGDGGPLPEVTRDGLGRALQLRGSAARRGMRVWQLGTRVQVKALPLQRF